MWESTGSPLSMRLRVRDKRSSGSRSYHRCSTSRGTSTLSLCTVCAREQRHFSWGGLHQQVLWLLAAVWRVTCWCLLIPSEQGPTSQWCSNAHSLRGRRAGAYLLWCCQRLSCLLCRWSLWILNGSEMRHGSGCERRWFCFWHPCCREVVRAQVCHIWTHRGFQL